MKKLLLLLPLLFSLTACSTISRVLHTQSKIDKTTIKLNTTQDKRLDEIGKLSYGVALSLQATNLPAAELLNERVETIANPPTLDQINDVKRIVISLVNSNQTLLNQEDKKIVALQNNIESLNTKLNNQVQSQLKNAEQSAAELGKYTGWFGLKAIFQGLKTLCLSGIWVIAGVSIVFLLARIFASSNPIAGAALGVFEHIAATGIHLVGKVVPNAINLVKKGGQ